MSILEQLDQNLSAAGQNLGVVSKQIADLVELERNLRILSERIKDSGTDFGTINQLLRGSSKDFQNVLAFLTEVVEVLNRSDPQKILATMDRMSANLKAIREDADVLERSYQDIGKNTYDIQLHTSRLEEHLDTIRENQVDSRKAMEDIVKRIAVIKYTFDESMEHQSTAIAKAIDKVGRRLSMLFAGLFAATWIFLAIALGFHLF